MGGMLPVIIHLDLDCFYCQVEQKRLGISRDVPCAVQQWSNLIAVNYKAREFGINRHLSAAEAKSLCPQLQCLHIPTFLLSEPTLPAAYHSNPTSARHKASLEPYRRASKEIFNILQDTFGNVEKAGTDEAFIDVTDLVHNQLSASNPEYLNLIENKDLKIEFDSCKIDWEDLGALNINIESQYINRLDYINDLRVKEGARIARDFRRKLSQLLDYEMSAGISHNKMLAKLGSAYNKPNNQTIIRSCQVLNFMKTVPLRKIRFLGGKLGSELSKIEGAETAGDLWRFTLEELEYKLGSCDTAKWVFQIVRGIDTEGIKEKELAKSFMSSKSFPSGIEFADMEEWITVLVTELLMRVTEDFEENSRWPKTLTVS